MVSQDKLIKQGIYLTDNVFDEIITRLSKGVKASDTLEAFINKTKDYTINNPLVVNGFKDDMLEIILRESNNHKFGRPAQKEFVRATIENRVGDRIVDVGEDIKESVRDIVKHGYNNNLSQDEIADNISHRVTTIKNTRARTIARTEIARTATASDYVINKERGATHFTVDCRSTCCDICRKEYNFGKVEYTIDQVDKLPPRHPNCRCYARFFIKDGEVNATTTPPKSNSVPLPTPAQLKKNLRPQEREKYNSYHRNIVLQRDWLNENPNASAEEIAKHRKRLAFLEKKFEELRAKAVGGSKGGAASQNSTPKPKAKPKKTSKPKTPEVTEKPKPVPKTEPKPATAPTKIQTPTKEQLNKNLTKKEREEYKEHKDMVEWANGILKNPNMGEKQKTYAQKRLDEILPRFNELNKKALGLAPKTTRKRKNKSKSKNESKSEVKLNKPKNARLTKEECDSLTFEQLAEHHNATYKGIVKLDNHDGKEYHIFEQTFDNGETFKLHFEKGAVASYKNGGVATANEIIHEVFKVPEVYRKETNTIYFKNTQQGLERNVKGKLKSIGKDVGGYNISKKKSTYNFFKEHGRDRIFDPDHQIVINPKSFKKLKGFYDILTWRDKGDEKTSWKHIIHHEFTHSIDISREIWRNDKERLSYRKDFLDIEEEEPDFTSYANQKTSESFAEHGGYVSYMLANPEEQSKKIAISTFERDENGRQTSFIPVREEIDFEEYKKRFPKHYEYFTKLLNGEIAQ